MYFNKYQYEKVNNADFILVPKGENRDLANEMLSANGFRVPQFAGKCLHRPTAGYGICIGA